MKYMIAGSLLSASLAIFGCPGRFLPAAPQHPAVFRQTYRVPANEVWQATLVIAEPLGIAKQDQNAGLIEVEWTNDDSEGKGSFTQRFLKHDFWEKRFRLRIVIEETPPDTTVRVIADREERPPINVRDRGWVKMPTDGVVEQEFLRNLREAMGANRLALAQTA